MKQHIKHLILFLLVWLVFLNGCTSWRYISVLPDETAPTDIRLTLKNSQVLELNDAFTRGDTIVGQQTSTPHELVVIPLSDVWKIEEKKVKHMGPAAILVGGSVVIIGVALIIAASKAY
jgi:hypothetical protein